MEKTMAELKCGYCKARLTPTPNYQSYHCVKCGRAYWVDKEDCISIEERTQIELKIVGNQLIGFLHHT